MNEDGLIAQRQALSGKVGSRFPDRAESRQLGLNLVPPMLPSFSLRRGYRVVTIGGGLASCQSDTAHVDRGRVGRIMDHLLASSLPDAAASPSTPAGGFLLPALN